MEKITTEYLLLAHASAQPLQRLLVPGGTEPREGLEQPVLAKAVPVQQLLNTLLPILKLAAVLLPALLQMILKVFPEIAQVLPQALLALGKAVGELLQFLLPVGSFLSGIQHSLGQVLSKIVGGVLDFGSQLVQLREAAG